MFFEPITSVCVVVVIVTHDVVDGSIYSQIIPPNPEVAHDTSM